MTLNWGAATDNFGVAPLQRPPQHDDRLHAVGGEPDRPTDRHGFHGQRARAGHVLLPRHRRGRRRQRRRRLEPGHRVVTGDVTPPGAPGTLQATGSLGSASLSWGAASDNVGVVRYNVHRSTVAGFIPGASNRIAQPTGTTYTDVVAPGTYFYRVTAEDAAGNIGAPSNEAVATVTSDTTAPTVAVTAPAAGATVSGTVTVTANASDNVGVTSVQFTLDGAALGAADTSAPYSTSWVTTTAAPGSTSSAPSRATPPETRRRPRRSR